MRRHRAVVDCAREVAARYGFQEMATPIFEFTEVFKRTLGDTSDIVTKEMYTFAPGGRDQESESITLRPENTAGVARAFIAGGLAQQVPVKAFYAGPMFRRERPQKGRQRQFHQFGVELIGVPQPQADVEVIACGAQILEALGLQDAVVLELNTLGDPESRAAYRDALVAYFSDHRDDLSEDSRERLTRNPLRILDSKDEGDRRLVAEAPLFEHYLNQDSRDFFAAVRAGLDSLGIAYRLNPRLVRGLDYYCHTAFEFTTDRLGAQSAVMAGGRYDGLVEQLGGRPTPAIGFAIGLERTIALLEEEKVAPDLARLDAYLIMVGETAQQAGMDLAENLRDTASSLRIQTHCGGGSFKSQFKKADRSGARYAIVLGEDEVNRSVAGIKPLRERGEQEEVPFGAIAAYLTRKQN